MFDFSSIPFFDNHSHRINVENREITPLQLSVAFAHGWGPVNPEGRMPDSAEVENCDAEYAYHVMNMGVVKVLINRLAERFGCEADAGTVVSIRNGFTKEDGYGYARSLYEEARIVGEVVDDPAVFGDPVLNCFPTRIYRLFQMDPFFRNLLRSAASYDELKKIFTGTVRERLAEGFIGIKCHVFELCAGPLRIVEDGEAAACFDAARAGDRAAFETVYLAVFEQVLLLTQELNFTVHIHTGCTGNPNDLQTSTDPYRITPILHDPRFYASRIVFLHGNPPDFGHDAWICHGYPNVWMDLGWTAPWVSMNMDAVLKEVLSMAPHSKIMFGSGQHDHAEASWLAAYIARSPLERVMEEQVRCGLLSEKQAVETAELLLYKNAYRLYGIVD